MGREVRTVPANWQHPKDKNGYIPLCANGNTKFSKPLSELIAEWDEAAAKWQEGLRQNYGHGEKWIPNTDCESETYAEYAGDRPDEKDYMPFWPESERTHLQMYEDTTEGTPISPVMATPEELAHWLADNGASAMGSHTASYESWLATINAGWAPSMVMSPRGIQSGVDAMADTK